MFFFICRLHVKPENIVEICQTLEGVAKKFKAYEGCLDIQILRDINDERKFPLLSMWEKQRDLEATVKSEIFAALMGSKILLVETPEVRYMVEI
jgi:quinol monooxygenase YgiN